MTSCPSMYGSGDSQLQCLASSGGDKVFVEAEMVLEKTEDEQNVCCVDQGLGDCVPPARLVQPHDVHGHDDAMESKDNASPATYDASSDANLQSSATIIDEQKRTGDLLQARDAKQATIDPTLSFLCSTPYSSCSSSIELGRLLSANATLHAAAVGVSAAASNSCAASDAKLRVTTQSVMSHSTIASSHRANSNLFYSGGDLALINAKNVARSPDFNSGLVSPVGQTPALSMADITVVVPDFITSPVTRDDVINSEVSRSDSEESAGNPIEAAQGRVLVGSDQSSGVLQGAGGFRKCGKRVAQSSQKESISARGARASASNAELSDSGFSETATPPTGHEGDRRHANTFDLTYAGPEAKHSQKNNSYDCLSEPKSPGDAASPDAGDLMAIAGEYSSYESSDSGGWCVVNNNRSKQKKKQFSRSRGSPHNHSHSKPKQEQQLQNEFGSKPLKKGQYKPQQNSRQNNASGVFRSESSRGKPASHRYAGRNHNNSAPPSNQPSKNGISRPHSASSSSSASQSGHSKRPLPVTMPFREASAASSPTGLAHNRTPNNANHDQKISVQSSLKTGQQSQLNFPLNDNRLKQDNHTSAESIAEGPIKMNHSESPLMPATSSAYPTVLNGVKPELSIQVDENGNTTKMVPGADPALHGGEEHKADSGAEATSPGIHPKLEGKELAEQLQHQLEYYFSRENLAQDPYLVSQMDTQMYVPIWTIANFNAVKKLTSNLDLVVEALKASNLVQVDEKEEKVRPNQTRSSVILREIPGETPIESVKGLFSGEGCPKFLSLEFAGGTSWYVTFSNDTEALAAQRHLRENVGTFLGKPIMARIKFKAVHFGNYSVPPRGSQPPKSEAMLVNGANPTGVVTQPQQSPPAQQQPTSQPQQQAQQPQQIPPPSPQQITPQPLEFPQQMVIYPQGTVPHGASPHPSTHASVHPHNQPPFIARVASSPASVPNGTPGQPVFMVPHWPGMYSAGHEVLGHHPYHHPSFLTQAYKTTQAQSQSSTKAVPYHNAPRYTDVHKGINQRNYPQRKPSGGSYNQPPQSQAVHSQNQAATSQYILSSDPNPPGMDFGQADQAQLQVTHAPGGHYLPAIHAPFVTPQADVLMMRPPPIHPNQGPVLAPRHQREQRATLQMTGAHGGQRMGAGGNAGVYNTSQNAGVSSSASSQQRNNGRQQQQQQQNRSYQNNHHSEISPRFQQKTGQQFATFTYSGGNSHPHSGGVYSGQKGPNVQTVHVEPGIPLASGGDQRLGYPGLALAQKPVNGLQRNRSSPPGDHSPEDHKFPANQDDQSTESQRNIPPGQRTLASTQPPLNGTYGDPRNGRQMPLDRRSSNIRPSRRPRREDERGPLRTSPPPNSAMGANTPFTLESNSFPPLPGHTSTAPAASNGASGEGRPATADVVRGIDAGKAPLMSTGAHMGKKYSEVSCAPPVPVLTPQVPPPAPQQAPRPAPVPVMEFPEQKAPKPQTPMVKPPQAPPTMVEVVERNANQTVKPRPHPVAKKPEAQMEQEKPKPAPQSTPEIPQNPPQSTPKPDPVANVTKMPPVTMPKAHSFKKVVASSKSEPAPSKSAADVVSHKTEASNPRPSEPAPQKGPSRDKESKPQARSVKEGKESNPTEDEKSPSVQSSSPTPESDGRKPTYADMLRKKQQQQQKADAAAAQASAANGKDSSDSGDDVRANDEARDVTSDVKSGDAPAVVKPHRSQRRENEEGPPQGGYPGRFEGGMHNGGLRRGGFEYNRNPRGYYRRDQYEHRNYGYNGAGRGGGPRDFRPRGGHRGARRGGYRDHYPPNRGPPMNGPSPAPQTAPGAER